MNKYNLNILSKKKIKINIIILFFLIVILSIGSTPDWENYKIIYENHQKLSPDYGMYFFIKIFKKMNLELLQLRNFYYILSTFFIFKFVRDIKIGSFSIILFLIFPFFYFAVQFRFFLALSIFFYSLLFVEKKWKFLVLNILAIIFHKTIILFTVFYIFYKLDLKKYIRYIFLINILLGLIFKIIVKLIIKIPEFRRFAAYIEADKMPSNLGLIYSLMGNILILLLIYLIGKYQINNIEKVKEDKIYLILIKFSLYTFNFLCLGKISLDFIQRYIYGGQFVCYCFIMYSLKYFNDYKVKITLKILILLITVFQFLSIHILVDIKNILSSDAIQLWLNMNLKNFYTEF